MKDQSFELSADGKLYNVMFTKHITQKRKVWRDGKLHIGRARVFLMKFFISEFRLLYMKLMKIMIIILSILKLLD